MSFVLSNFGLTTFFLLPLGLWYKGVTKEQVSQVPFLLRKVGCRCVLDEPKRVVHKTGKFVVTGLNP